MGEGEKNQEGQIENFYHRTHQILLQYFKEILVKSILNPINSENTMDTNKPLHSFLAFFAQSSSHEHLVYYRNFLQPEVMTSSSPILEKLSKMDHQT